MLKTMFHVMCKQRRKLSKHKDLLFTFGKYRVYLGNKKNMHKINKNYIENSIQNTQAAPEHTGNLGSLSLFLARGIN